VRGRARIRRWEKDTGDRRKKGNMRKDLEEEGK